MITEQEGISDKNHLAKTICDFSSLPHDKNDVLSLLDRHLEFSKEIYKDGVLSGYALVFNFLGVRSFHGYKLTEGFGVRAFRIAREMIRKFDIKIISTTIDQIKTIRIAKLLGFSESQRFGDVLVLQKGAA